MDDTTDTRGITAAPWNIGDLVKAVLVSAFFIIAAVVGIIASGLLLRSMGIYLEESRVLLVVVLVVVQNVSFIIGVWAFGLRKYGGGLARLGLRPFVASAGCGYSALALLVAFGFNLLYSGMLGGLGRPIQPPPVLPLFGGGLFGFVLALVIASGIVPFVEEVFFRGFIFPGLARRFGFTAGLLISAVLFGAAHLSPEGFIPLSFFGLLLGLLYSATGSLYPGIVMHSVNNSMALLLAFLMEYGLIPGS